MVRLPDFGASTSAAPQDDQSAAVLDWLGAAVPGFVLFRLRADGTLASVSEGWSEATGLPASATIGRRLIDLVHPDDRQRVGRLLEPKDAPATSETDLRITGADGRERQLVAVRGPDLSGEGGRDVVGMLRDVFADRAIERQLAAAYSYDMLTAVPNRTLFLDRLGEAVRAARATGEGLALLVCDIDRFRALNETAGHRPADELLRIVARRLERQVRGGDTIGRIGADEFGVIQTGVRSLDDVRSLADRLAFVLSKPYRAEGIRLRASCSVGVAVLAAEGGVESLLSDAHLALNQAKRVGRGQVRFADPAVGGAERERLSLEEDLLQAIDEAGLTLHFQPFVDLETGRISGAEALLRWPHPERGFIEPSRFVPLAEATGAIRPLGAWVLDAACAALRRWDNRGLPDLKIAVNVSAAQFRDAGVYEAVNAALDRNGVAPRRLELEVTETAMLEDKGGEAVSQLTALARRGVQIVIDDFGMGYGTLTYLRSFPVSKIKIDRAFIATVQDDPRDAAIVRGVAALGASLGLKVQPEGVETEVQLAFVQDLGCSEVQGFLVSRALPEPAFVAFVEDWERRRGALVLNRAGQDRAAQASVEGRGVHAMVRQLAQGVGSSPAASSTILAAGAFVPSLVPSVGEGVADPEVPRAPGWERALVVAGVLIGLWGAIGVVVWGLT